MITLVVFSKDRALQCDSLLRSVKDHCTGIDEVKVIAHASTSRHEKAYWEMANDERTPFHELRMEVDKPLGTMVEELIFGSKHIAFAVDDQIFYRPSNFALAAKTLDAEKAFVWSWRYGAERPDAECSTGFWRGPAGYAWHVDGSLYRTADYVWTLDHFYPGWRTEARTPNDLEGVVAARAKWSSGIIHVGPLEPTCMTWQINQAHATPGVRRAPFVVVPETQIDALAAAYLAGRRVDNEKLYADLSWTTRFQKQPGQTHVAACEEASRFYAELIR